MYELYGIGGHGEAVIARGHSGCLPRAHRLRMLGRVTHTPVALGALLLAALATGFFWRLGGFLGRCLSHDWRWS